MKVALGYPQYEVANSGVGEIEIFHQPTCDAGGDIRVVGATSKGEPTYYPVRPPAEIRPLLEAKRREAGVSSVAQYLADLLAIHLGRPDLACELGKKQPLEELGLEVGVLPLAV